MSKLTIVFNSIKNVLKRKNYFLMFLVTSIIFLALFILIPVFIIPGNSLKFQLGIFMPLNYFVMILFSSLAGLMISMRTYNYKMKKSLIGVGGGVFGGFFGFVAGIFGTVTCPACVAAIFGFLGTGATLFLIEKQWYIMSIAAVFLLVSIYLTSLSIEKKCEKCC